MKYKELVDFFEIANCDTINYLEQIRGRTGEEIAICSDPELNLLWGIRRAQDLIHKATKEYERIAKRKRHQNPAPEIKKTKKEIDVWITNQDAKKAAEDRKRRTQNLILLGSTYLPILNIATQNLLLDDSKIQKLRKILNRNQTEILSILD